MPKRPNLLPKVTRHKISDTESLFEFKDGDLDLSTFIKFKNKAEEKDFYKTRDLCVEQTRSTDGINKTFNPDGRTLQVGEMIEKKFYLVYNVIRRITLLDIPGLHTEQEFVEVALEHSSLFGEPEIHDLEAALKEISAHLFPLNAQHLNENLFGKMMNLLAILCSYSAHSQYLRNAEHNQREKLASKLGVVEKLFKHGLITGSPWSSAAFWNGVKSQLMIEYDSIPEKSLLSPFTQPFRLLKDIASESKQVEKSMFNSIRYILDKFMVYNKFAEVEWKPSDLSLRRMVTDRFRHLPKYISDPGFEMYTYQQKL